MANSVKINQISISAWNIHGLGDKIKDDIFQNKIKNDINILLETWKGENKEISIEGFRSFTKIRKRKKNQNVTVGELSFSIKNHFIRLSHILKMLLCLIIDFG